MRSEKALIIIGYILISLIWGSTWLVIKIGLESIPPFFGIAIRFTLATVVLFLILKIRGESIPLDRKSFGLYTILALFSFSIPYALVYWGEQHITSGLASVLFGSYPFVVAVGSHFFLPRERLNPYKTAGVFLGFAGILVIFWNDLASETLYTLGMAAILLSTVMQGISLVAIKRINHAMSATSLSFGGMALGLAIMYPLAFIFEDISAIHFDIKGVGSILYLGTFGTVLTFVVYYWLMKRVEIVYLSLVSFVTPLLAVLLGGLLYNEVFSPQIFVGAGLVLTGILTANSKDLMRIIKKVEQR